MHCVYTMYPRIVQCCKLEVVLQPVEPLGLRRNDIDQIPHFIGHLVDPFSRMEVKVVTDQKGLAR